MKRTSKKTIPVHVTIPVRLLEDFDETLSFKQSRSKKIAEIMKAYLNREHIHEVWKLTPLELLDHLMFRVDKDSPEDVLIQSLLQLFSKKL
jgi:hypothetical protein